MLRNLHSQAKDLSAIAAKDRRQLTKARVITQKEVVPLREERERKEAEKSARAESRKIKQEAAAAIKAKGSNTTGQARKQHHTLNTAGVNLQGAGSKREEDSMDEGWISEEESGDEEDPLVPTGGSQEYMQAGDDGEEAGIVGRRVEVVTRSGRRAGCVIYN
ncbi:hypothetical protein BDD12DRAFT_807569 [Trichophaea hybrida]|nr:hypothetical protein BDD12DRAFT_807569 [Trichophaea hybrida]